MAEIIFFEKPGCINNTKQKNILHNGGNTIRCIDILSYRWTKAELLPFLSGRRSQQIINTTAPIVKRGDLIPSKLSFNQAVDLMLKDPILIKRPLIKIDELHIQGFDDARLKPYLGFWDDGEDVTTCPNLQTISCDEKMGKQ